MIKLAIILIILHAPGGAAIEVNPDQITSLRNKNEENETYVTRGANCQINLTDGKYALVMETCAEVRKLVEDIK
jgi:hypothetical protein